MMSCINGLTASILEVCSKADDGGEGAGGGGGVVILWGPKYRCK